MNCVAGVLVALVFQQAFAVARAANVQLLPRSLENALGIPQRQQASQGKSSRKKKLEPYRIVLDNSDDVQYVATLQVGGQNISGIMDTGSFELLVFSKSCRLCGVLGKLYDPELSNTHVQGTIDKMHSFGSGDTWSHEAYDTVSIGPLAAVNQSFWEVIDTAMPILQSSVFQAIVGLGPPGSALQLARKQSESAMAQRQDMILDGGSVPSFLDADVQDSVKAAEHARWKRSFSDNLGVRTYSICIGRKLGDPGHLIWNDVDPREKPSVFVRLELTGSLHWSVRLTGVRIAAGESPEGVSLGCTDDGPICGAVLDSGTSLIGAPREAIDKVSKVLDTFSGDCSRVGELPDLRFNLAGIEMSLPPESYVGEVSGEIPTTLAEILRFKPRNSFAGSGTSYDRLPRGDGFCQPLLMSIDSATSNGPMWIFGLPFFRKYYTTFQSFPVEEAPNEDGSPRRDFKNQVYVALADEQCSPTPPTFLEGQSQRFGRHHLKVDASKLRVPHYVSQMVEKRARSTGKERLW